VATLILLPVLTSDADACQASMISTVGAALKCVTPDSRM
jgi:hypothetical protein